MDPVAHAWLAHFTLSVIVVVQPLAAVWNLRIALGYRLKSGPTFNLLFQIALVASVLLASQVFSGPDPAPDLPYRHKPPNAATVHAQHSDWAWLLLVTQFAYLITAQIADRYFSPRSEAYRRAIAWYGVAFAIALALVAVIVGWLGGKIIHAL